MSIHAGHRKRLKNRFRQEGLDHFDPVNVLELLLFFGVPQGDTNPLAHELLKRFGGISQVLEAPVEDLEQVPGVGEHVSTLISLVKEISRYYMVSRDSQLRILRTIEECGRYMLPYFVGRRDETVFLLCLDGKCKVLCCREIGSGSANAASFSIRDIVSVALSVNASSCVLAHNHPSGLAIPSQEDILTTKRLAVALDAVGIRLSDHLVVADDDYVSIADSGYYRPEDYRLLV